MEEIKNLNIVKCPYCTAQSLEQTDLLTEIYFQADDELTMAHWMACRCATCLGVVVFDREEVERVQ